MQIGANIPKAFLKEVKVNFINPTKINPLL